MNHDSILHEEPSFLVLNKPSSLLTQAAPGVPSVETELRALLRQRPSEPSNPFVGLPHRLDRGTSGVLLIARNERSLKRFGLQFQTRKVSKVYLAVCEGEVTESAGTWKDYVRKIPNRPMSEIVDPAIPGAKEAILHFVRLAVDSNLSLLQLQLETGRMHQIRLQAASRGHPVLGDWCYGSQVCWGEVDPEGRWQQLALHAHRLSFRHPLNGKILEFVAPLPEAWNQIPSRLLQSVR